MARISKAPDRIRRGDIWASDLRPGIGWEVSKRRPALIISHNAINNIYPTVIVIPISSQVPRILGPERVFISQKGTKLLKDSVILTTQIRAIDKTRLIKKIGSVSRTKLAEVEQSINIVLDLVHEEN